MIVLTETSDYNLLRSYVSLYRGSKRDSLHKGSAPFTQLLKDLTKASDSEQLAPASVKYRLLRFYLLSPLEIEVLTYLAHRRPNL